MGTSFHTHGGSRTHDPLLRRQLLYPTELREQVGVQYSKILQIIQPNKDFRFSIIYKKVFNP